MQCMADIFEGQMQPGPIKMLITNTSKEGRERAVSSAPSFIFSPNSIYNFAIDVGERMQCMADIFEGQMQPGPIKMLITNTSKEGGGSSFFTTLFPFFA